MARMVIAFNNPTIMHLGSTIGPFWSLFLHKIQLIKNKKRSMAY